jgi:hydroxymethylpyrimidine pyrophosphatase-like HAD family hydrolase
VTRKGIDKAYGVRKLIDRLGVGVDNLLFIGDRLDEAGNDYPVYELGVASVPVHGWHDTLAVVTSLCDWLEAAEGEFPVETMAAL